LFKVLAIVNIIDVLVAAGMQQGKAKAAAKNTKQSKHGSEKSIRSKRRATTIAAAAAAAVFVLVAVVVVVAVLSLSALFFFLQCCSCRESHLPPSAAGMASLRPVKGASARIPVGRHWRRKLPCPCFSMLLLIYDL